MDKYMDTHKLSSQQALLDGLMGPELFKQQALVKKLLRQYNGGIARRGGGFLRPGGAVYQLPWKVTKKSLSCSPITTVHQFTSSANPCCILL